MQAGTCFSDGLYLPGPSSPPSNLMLQWTKSEKNRVGGLTIVESAVAMSHVRI